MQEQNSPGNTADNGPDNSSEAVIKKRGFLVLLALISLLFFYLMRPYFSAIFWAIILGLIFTPLHRYITRLYGGRQNLAAISTLLIILCLVIIPALFVLNAMINQATGIYQQLQSGTIDPGSYLDSIYRAFPALQSVVENLEIDLQSIKNALSSTAVTVSRFVGQNALALGQGTLAWFVQFSIMLYVTFYMLRDGPALARMLARALPLEGHQQHLLFTKFNGVCLATIKGNLVVAIIQGSLGGLILWLLGIPGPLLWGVIMILLSLIPIVGAFVIWAPIALYLFATGDIIKGAILALFGICVIGLVDNLLRPLLVGRDTKLPDYMVLLSTLGGFSLFGMNGFVLGPLIAALFMAFWGLFMEEYNQPGKGI